MSNQKTTPQYSAELANAFADDIASGNVYVVVGGHVSTGNDAIAETAVGLDAQQSDLLSQGICATKLSAADISISVPRNDWVTGQPYESYSAYTSNLCHVSVNAGAFYQVYKCLSNNDGSNSTVAPSGTSSLPFQTADGYVWVYMYSVPAATYATFLTADRMPYQANTARIQASIPSTVDAVVVEDGGIGYLNTHTGAFASTDIAISGNTQYRLNSTASGVSNFYEGCYLRITTPTSPAFGQYRKITAYSAAREATLDSAFTALPVSGDAYEVLPSVAIEATDPTAVLAKAAAHVVDGVVDSIEILNRGTKHGKIISATVYANAAAVPQRAAKLQAVVSPPKGHGHNPPAEFGNAGVTLSKQLNFATIGVPATNDFRQVSLVKDPTFNNVSLTLTSGVPAKFDPAEQLVQYAERGSIGSVSVNNAAMTGTGFTESLANLPYIVVTSGNARFISKVSQVNSNTSATLATPYTGTISGTAAIGEITGTATVRGNVSTSLVIDNVSPSFVVGGKIYGMNSFASDTITAVDINGKGVALFDHAILLNRYQGVISGTFAADEVVKPTSDSSSTAPKAYVHSVSGNVVYVSNVTKNLTAVSLTGQTSTATVATTTKYSGDLTPDSGQVLLVRYNTPVTKAANKATSVRLSFQF